MSKLVLLVAVYFDDVLAESRPNSALRALDNEFKLLYDNQLYINFKKCCFLTEKSVFLGYVVTVGHLQMDEAKEDAILNWPTTKNFTSV